MDVTSSTQLLSNRILLPPESAISYSVFAPSTTDPHTTIESARRLILSRNSSALLLDSLLTAVHIGTTSFLHVFRVSAQSQLNAAMSTLTHLQLDGLTAIETSSFGPQDLYPCSPSCSALCKPCATCLDHPIPSLSPASLLPRKPLRSIYINFIDAVRIRLLDDIVSASATNTTGRPVKRLKGGILLGTPSSKNEWSATWDDRAMARPLLYCQLQIHLIHQRSSPSYLIIHPLLLPTSFLPLRHSLPLPSGTPITLLPHGIPAFFLAKYTGPISALTKQFHESLQGLGVRGWESSSQTSSRSSHESPTFILAWISVENKQGEDKGIIIIYPAALCLTFIPSSRHSSHRQPLNYIPELPVPLQPSPQVPSALPTSTTSYPLSCSPISAQASESPLPLLSLSALHRPAFPSSSFESLRAFRSLTLSRSKDLQLVAIEVGGYVDAVARERERERERLKRERERETSGSRTAAATPTSTSAPGPVPAVSDTPTPGALPYTHPPGPSQSQPQVHQQVQPPHLQLQVTLNQSQGPTQNSYPSPPQTNSAIMPAPAAQTSPVAEVNLLPPTTTSSEPTTDLPSASAPTTKVKVDTGASTSATSTSTGTYDSLNNSLESTWAAQPQPYLGLGMDIDIDFNLEMSMGFGMGDGGDMGMEYEDEFTEDDFSFFDRPSAGAPVRTGSSGSSSAITAGITGMSGSVGGTATRAGLGVGLGIGLAMTPPPFSHDDHLGGPIMNSGSGLGPTSVPLPPTPHSTSNSITHFGASPFDPSAVTPYHFPAASDLFPLSPGPIATPFSHSVLPTPAVHLEPDTPSSSARIFDPIPFAAYHRALDGKYAVGKFAFPSSLPSPPDEEVADDLAMQRMGLPKSGTFVLGIVNEKGPGSTVNGWKSKYEAATNPRIGVVRKLIGVKRKICVQGGRDTASGISGTKKLMSPAWIREHEDWEGSSSPPKADVDSRSEADSESEEDEDDYAESPIVSRPSTPLPAYLPLGPTLLSTHFEHSQLLPLSTPLRPPGAAVAPTNITISAPAASVPTPVSPAATMGAASEKSKSLEAAAFTLATEVVENPLWADAWCASSFGGRQPSGVWPADVRNISQLLEAVPGLEDPLDIGTLFGLEVHSRELSGSKAIQPSIQPLETPMISVGKGDAVIQILPTALRFWEKLGLGPRGGQKNATLFVLFEDDGVQRQQQIENWLSSVAAIYEGKHFGALVRGSCSACPKDGLVPLRFDSSFRKSLTALISSFPASESSLIFFIVTPILTMTLASPVLRQVFSAVKKTLKTYSEVRILFQFIPEQHILGYMGNPSANFSDLEALCTSLYDRIQLPADRYMSRPFFEHGECVRKYFQEPAITLARPLHNKVSFIRASRAPLDVMDRHTFLHIGYQVSPCGKWILSACVDQRGEAHDLGVWLTQTPVEGGESDVEISKELFLVQRVWEFAVQFARRANVEWRLVFSKLGAMGESEIEAWIKYLDATIATRDELAIAHISLLSVEPDAPWTFISRSNTNANVSPKPKPPSPKNQNNHPQIFTDITTTFFFLAHRNHSPQSFPLTPADLGLCHSYIPESSPAPSSSSTDTEHTTGQYPYPHRLPLLPHSSTTLVCLPAASSPTSISMLHIHLMHVFSPLDSTSTSTKDEVYQLHADITRNFHELAVLASARWRLGVNPLLPFHLAAVEAMRIGLDRDRDRSGCDGEDV